MRKQLCIVGTGGSARETLEIALHFYDRSHINFLVKDEEWTEEIIMGVKQLKESELDINSHAVCVAIGDIETRKNVVSKLPENLEYITLIDPSAQVSEYATIGEGSIISKGSIISCNVTLGSHSQINLNSTISHDVQCGNFFTASPGVNVSGHVTMGNEVFMGTGAVTINNIEIINNTIIGAGAVVVGSIYESGIYIGNPAKKR